MQCNGYVNIYTALDKVNNVIQRLPIVRPFKVGLTDTETARDVVNQMMSEGLTVLANWASEEFMSCAGTLIQTLLSVLIFSLKSGQ